MNTCTRSHVNVIFMLVIRKILKVKYRLLHVATDKGHKVNFFSPEIFFFLFCSYMSACAFTYAHSFIFYFNIFTFIFIFSYITFISFLQLCVRLHAHTYRRRAPGVLVVAHSLPSALREEYILSVGVVNGKRT